MLQLLLGNIGRPGGGLNALRGHANIQGGTDCGVAYHNLPGYIAIPKADHPNLESFVAAVTPKPLREGETNFWSNTDRFVVSQLKAYYGDHATRDNGFGYSLHPRLPHAATGGYENWSWAYIFDHMYAGRMEGLISFGMNPVSNGPHSRKVVAALAKLKWLVVAENFEQETATFWRDDILALVDKKPEDVQTEVFQLPAANFAEKDGSFVNSARWIQWKWKAVDPPGDAKPDQEIIARIFLKVRELYARDGGRLPEPVQRLNWWYSQSVSPITRRSRQGDQRVGDYRRSGSANEGHHPARRAAAFPLPRHPRGRHARSRATGSTSGCTPTRATSRSGGPHRTPAAWGDIQSGPSVGRPTDASSTTAAPQTRRAAPGTRRVRASCGTGRDGRVTYLTSPSTVRRPPGSARS